MSYHTWTTDGFGICVDDIYGPSLSVDKILRLAAMEQDVLADVQDYIDQFCIDEDIEKDEFTLDDFDEMEGDFGERGITYVLLHVIEKELPVIFADDFDGTPYILYCPSYPWNLSEKERNLTKEDVVKIFTKYVNILTDVPVKVEAYIVENGG